MLKKNILRRGLSVLLAMFMLLLSASLFACAKTVPEPSPQGTLNTETTTLEQETVDERLIPGLEIIDQKGKVFHIFGNPPNSGNDWWVHDMLAEKYTGETINDSIFERNTFLEYAKQIVAKNAIQTFDIRRQFVSFSLFICKLIENKQHLPCKRQKSKQFKSVSSIDHPN